MNSVSDNKRIQWVDAAKGLGIFLVVFGHIYSNEIVFNWLYSFHMPLFFFLGGYVYKKREVIADIKKRFSSTMIPYFVLGGGNLVYWIFVERKYRETDVGILDALLGFLRGQYETLDFNVHLWFLPCFFLTGITVNLLYRYIKRKVYLVAIVVSFVYFFIEIPPLLWGADRSIKYIMFFVFGMISRELVDKEKITIHYSVGILLFFSTIPMSFLNSKYMWYPLGLAGSIGICILGKLIYRNRLIRYIGVNSVVTLCVHGPVYRIILKVMSLLLRRNIEFIRESFVFAFIATIITMAICCVASVIINKWIPWSIGKGKRTVIKRKIRILHVAECAGGVDRYLYSLVKFMNRDKYENILVLSHLYDIKKYQDIADAIECIEIKHSIGFNSIKSTIELKKLLKKYNPDIVYAHSSIAGAISRMACWNSKIKVIYNPHGWSFNMKNRMSKLYILIEKIMAPFCEVIVCISEAEKESALKHRICCNEKLYVIYNGIEIVDIKSKRKADLGIPENAYVVGMVGRICKQKAQDVFVKMSEYLRDVYFVIVGDVFEGDADERRQIETLAQKYDARLTITGWVNNPLDYVGVFDVACLLSRWEGFGLALPEYMLCGKPIVATNVDAIPYIIRDGENGILVGVDDYKAAAEAVELIRRNNELRNRLVSNGLKEVRNKYDVRRVARETEEVISEIVSGRN